MDFNDLDFLSKLTNWVQFTAIALIFLGAVLQASRFYLDKRIRDVEKNITTSERLDAAETISKLEETISQQAQTIEGQSNQIESQQSQIQEVESKTKSRSIPDDKLSSLKSELSKHKGEKIEITCVMGDQEAFGFASQLKSVFESSGWEVSGVNQAVYTKPVKGLIVALKDESAKPKAEFLFHVLNSVGFKSIGEMNDKIKFDVGIVVGSKN